MRGLRRVLVCGALRSLGVICGWGGLLILLVICRLIWDSGLLIRVGGRIHICWVWLVVTIMHHGLHGYPVAWLGAWDIVWPISLHGWHLLISNWRVLHRRVGEWRVGEWRASFGCIGLFSLCGRPKDKERRTELIGLMFHDIHNIEGFGGRGFLLFSLVLGLG